MEFYLQIFGEPVLPMVLGVVLGFVVRMEPWLA